MRKCSRFFLNNRDLKEYLNEVDFLNKRAEKIRREEGGAKSAAKSENS